ncbi:hypothetical protein [Kitasatospora viridis]|uniref:Uncharacterized protein n=1 Tax=Kitasatospora viridis TaxID=281105 RepID=A0A561S9V3_9ACTN|nr:hypothetical protein [Kitasatospora viridis]TWF71651.1 hypothetical protein FHX73_1822 [Kitasatospora viridis]
MFVTRIKTIGLEAFKVVFDSQYDDPEFRDLPCSLEYPVSKTAFPSVWINYSDTDKIERAGVAHLETTHPTTGGLVAPYTRWRFHGSLSYTVVALSSLQRDRIFDQLLRVTAFGGQDQILGRFRRTFETNDLIAVNVQWDQAEPTGDDASPGTPWETDEIVYERTLTIDLQGEFIPDPATNTLVPLSRFQVTATPDMSIESNGGGFGIWH